ncbi:hypothetical protein T4E_6106, partial [Trichinella pseudospiralis]
MAALTSLGTTSPRYSIQHAIDLCNAQLLVVRLLCRNDGCIGGQGEVDTWIRNQVCLELRQIHIKCTVETQRCRDGAHNLTNQPVE